MQPRAEFTASLLHSTRFLVPLLLLLVLGTMAMTPARAGWEMQWIERFDGDRLDLANWTPQIQANYNNEDQCYTDDDSTTNRNYDISGGILKIIARRQSINCPGQGGRQRDWTSGRINSKDKREFRYGRIEARIRYHNLEQGTWPAFWMLENRIAENPIKGDNDFVNWPNPGAGEIDVWEWFSNGPDSYITNFFNTSGCGSEVRYAYPGGRNDVLQWHDYAMEWEPNQIRFYIDDTLVISHDTTSCAQYKEPMFVLLNVAIGGTLGGFVEPGLNLATMDVDYVAHCSATTSNNLNRCNQSTPAASAPPEITSTPSSAIAINLPYRYTLTAIDTDNDPLTLAVITKPDWLEFVAFSGLLSGVPSLADIGFHNVILGVSGGGDTTTQNFTIEVRKSDTPPFIVSQSKSSATIGNSYQFQLIADDADGDSLTIWITSSPGWLSFDPVGGMLSGTPTAAYLGNNNVNFAVSDGSNTITSAINISVLGARSNNAAATADPEADDSSGSGGGGGFGISILLLALLRRRLGSSAAMTDTGNQEGQHP
jgi:beta-glucanase (GH16 family)